MITLEGLRNTVKDLTIFKEVREIDEGNTDFFTIYSKLKSKKKSWGKLKNEVWEVCMDGIGEESEQGILLENSIGDTYVITSVEQFISLLTNTTNRKEKEIVVGWKKDNSSYNVDGFEMIVLGSNHPRFVLQSRFDFGFMTVASREGYTTILLHQDTK